MLDRLYPQPQSGRQRSRESVAAIQAAACEHFGLSREELLSPSRTSRITWPRQVAMYLARELTSESLPAIGRQFGGRDHTTVLHAWRRITTRIADDHATREAVDDAPQEPRAQAPLTHARPPSLKDCRQAIHSLFTASFSNHVHPSQLHMFTTPTDLLSCHSGVFVKLSLSAAELLTQLQTVTRVASTRSAVQALSGVMISAPSDSTPELLATDMEIGLRVPLQAETINPGSAVLPARLLLDVARSLPGEKLTMELRSSEQDVELICGPATFHLRMLRAEDFPTLPNPTPETRITLPREAFVQTRLTRRALGVAGRDAPRADGHPHVGLRTGAAHGRDRLLPTQRQGDHPRGRRWRGASRQMFPPARSRSWCGSPNRARSDSLAVSVGQSQVVFELGDVVLSSRLIDGQFPNYRQLLPESVDHELRLATAELAEVVRRISLLAQKNAPLRLSFSEGTLTDLGADPRHRRGQRGDPGSLPRRVV